MINVARREFLKVSMTIGGALAIEIHPSVASSAPVATGFEPHVLVTVFPDNTVQIKSKNPEIGQGIKSALPMILAEEMDVAWESVSVVQAMVDAKFGNQFAGGSLGIRLNWNEMRTAGASIRELFLLAAARKWTIEKTHCAISNGIVTNLSTGQIFSYGELIGEANSLKLPPGSQCKDADQYRIVGNEKFRANIDSRDIVSGKQQYSSDIKRDGMLHASIERAPFFEGQVASVDDRAARKVPGVKAVFVLNNSAFGGRLLQANSPNFVSGVAVLATNTWSALQGRKALKIRWLPGPVAESTKLLEVAFREGMKDSGEIVRQDGQKPAGTFATIESSYRVPFLAHVTMEPMNCTAHYQGGRCEIWAPTQNPEYIVQGIERVLAIKKNKITIHLIRAGGGFGRRYYADFCIDAALLSKMANAPVKVMWTREDDIRHDLFRPAGRHRLTAWFDTRKQEVVHWEHKIVGASRNQYLGREGPPSDTEIENDEFPAGFVPNLCYEFVNVATRIPTGQWRSVSNSSNVFVVQSFLDEIAHRLKIDPIDFYLRFLGSQDEKPVVKGFNLNAKRLRNVVHLLRETSNWTTQGQETNIGRGFAASYNQGTFVAMAAIVRVVKQQLKVLKVSVAVDCGLVIHPSGARAQVEGSIVEGLSSALLGKIEVEASRVKQSNFHDYPWIRLADMPEVSIQFVKSTEAPRGLGEPVLPLVAPAICNAIFDASGKRIYDLPVVDNGYVLAG